MRLFGRVDGTISRLDRAAWLTCPFDLAFALPAVVVAAEICADAGGETRFGGVASGMPRHLADAGGLARYAATVPAPCECC